MLFLANATIIDGTGVDAYPGGLLLRDGLIEQICSSQPPGIPFIDLQGLAVAPGFIDLHSHSDLMVQQSPREKMNQGVTAEVVGNCGFSPYPCGPNCDLLIEQNAGILYGRKSWPHAADYLQEARAHSPLVHIESLVGHGALRTAVYGADAGKLSLDRLPQMERLLDEALHQGAVGLSSGLMYSPGSEAPFEELEALCRIVARHGKLYTTHMRSYSWTLLEAIEEQLELARRTGCRLQLSHLQAVGRANWHKQTKALQMIEDARAEGIDVAFDCYPYLAGSTVMTQLLPQSVVAQGTPALLTLLASASSRRELIAYLENETAQAWNDIYISSLHSSDNQRLVGQSLANIADERNIPAPVALLNVLLEEECRVNILAFNQSEENLREMLTHPLSSIITDGFYVSGKPHPRLAGAFPLFLGEYVREKRWLSLPEAVRKITHAPAERLGLRGRGAIVPGNLSDLVVFDPAEIGTTASYEHPTRTPHGISLIFKGQFMRIPSSSLMDKGGKIGQAITLDHAKVWQTPATFPSRESVYEWC